LHKGKSIVPASEVASRVNQFLDSAIKYYEELGYRSTLLFRALLDDTLEYVLDCDLEHPPELIYSSSSELSSLWSLSSS